MPHTLKLDEYDMDELTVINIGPQHPSTHGVLRLLTALDGEVIVYCEPDIGYLHTGIEKQAEVKTYNQALTLTDRMDYLAPLSNNLGYSLGVEKLLGIQVPERVSHIRVLLAELQRIASHMVWSGTGGLDGGASSPFLYCFEVRERILDLFETISGVRLMTSYITPGGLMADLVPGFLEQVRDVLDWVEDKYLMIYGLLKNNPMWQERTQGVGIATPELIEDYCLTGAVARASGIDFDLRKQLPYAAYSDYEFSVPVMHEGDCWARYIVRMEEVRESIYICRQALKKITPTSPQTKFRTDDRKISPPPKYEIRHSMEALIHHFKLFTEGYTPSSGEVYSRVEGPRGEVCFTLVSDGSNKPYRMRVKTPSLLNIQAIPALVEGLQIADLVMVMASLDFVLGDCDR